MMRSETLRGLRILVWLIWIDWETRLLTNAVRGADPEVRATFAAVAREMQEEWTSDRGDTAG